MLWKLHQQGEFLRTIFKKKKFTAFLLKEFASKYVSLDPTYTKSAKRFYYTI